MSDTYHRIFSRCGLTTVKVAADNGYIGGEYCHEFQVAHPEGEGKFFTATSGEYCAHEDVAKFELKDMNLDAPINEYQTLEAVRGTTMVDGQKHHNLPMWQQLKDVMFSDESGKLVLALVRGDLEVNVTKLLRVSGAARLDSATPEQIRQIGSEPGFISPVGLKGKVTIIADPSLRTVHNLYGGANQLNLDAVNINIDRDFQPDIEGDIAMAQDGFIAPNGAGTLVSQRGIEVGNIFQLGLHYSNLMRNATYTGEDGQQHPYYMGCYGIGLGRTLATIAEIHHDERGLSWPIAVAPYQVHLISIGKLDEQAEKIYQRLTDQGIEVLWDERDVSTGVKFGDADLIGCPVRLVISTKTGEKLEWKSRTSSATELLDLDQVIKRITDAKTAENI